METVSIIIPLKGKMETKNLENLLHQEVYDPEIIIVSSSGEMTSFDKRIKFVVSNARRSEAKNIGAMISKGSILLFLDSDMEVDNDFIKKGLNDLNGNDALIFPEITLGKGLISSGRRFERIGLYKSIYYEAPRMIKKEIFINIGGYPVENEAFEDLEVTSKLLLNGYKIGWSDNIIYHHEEEVNIIEYIKKRKFYMRNNKSLMKEKNPQFYEEMTNVKLRLKCFINSIKYYRLKSMVYLPGYLLVNFIDFFIFMVMR
ncbi:MAG: glycosyltransferase [Caldisphaera sp.]